MPVKKKVLSKATKEVENNKSTFKSELFELSRLITGELALKDKQHEIEKLKKEAIEKQKEKIRSGILKGKTVLEDDPLADKVVQKLKLFEWDAPIRVKVIFEMKYFMIVVALSLVFILFLAILGHYGLMFAIIALLFFIYASGTTDPIVVKHTITARGIDSMDKLYEWYMLNDFWFTNKNGQNMLIVETKLRLPTKLILLLDEKDRASIFLLLQDKLLYKDIRKQSGIDKLTFGEYVPLEKV
jgi:hypothetical protein